MLVLLNSGVASIIANQVLQSREPLLALARHIVLAVATGNLVVENTELLVHEREDETPRFALAPADEVGTWFGHTLESHACYITTDASVVPPKKVIEIIMHM